MRLMAFCSQLWCTLHWRMQTLWIGTSMERYPSCTMQNSKSMLMWAHFTRIKSRSPSHTDLWQRTDPLASLTRA